MNIILHRVKSVAVEAQRDGGIRWLSLRADEHEFLIEAGNDATFAMFERMAAVAKSVGFPSVIRAMEAAHEDFSGLPPLGK
jgi:hypothetical protein